MTILSEFIAGNIIRQTQRFSVESGSTILPISGTLSFSPGFLVTNANSTTNLRIRLYATPSILNDAVASVKSEKARAFGGITGSTLNSDVFSDLIVDIDATTLGPLVLTPPLFGGHAFTGSDEVYYYLTEGKISKTANAATASATSSLDGYMDLIYVQLLKDTGSTILTETFNVVAGTSGTSGSFTTPEIYAILSGSVEYNSGGGGSGWLEGSRLRIYQDQASMNATGEIDRAYLSDESASFQYISGTGIRPFSGSGIIVDILFTGSNAGPLFPTNLGANMYAVPTTESWYRYEPSASLASDASVDFHLKILGFEQ